MIHASHRVQVIELVGMLVVVERGSSMIRLARAVRRDEPLTDALRVAFESPDSPARRGRPKRVVVDDPALQQALAPLLAEAGVLSVSADATPTLDDAIARLLTRAGAPVAPGIDHDVASWRGALTSLIRLAPWTHLPRWNRFTFSGSGMDVAVASISGPDGTIPGVHLYPSNEHFQRHRSIAGTGSARAGLQMSSLLLEPLAGLSAEEYERCLRAGLQVPPGLYPRVYALEGAAPRAATVQEQGRLLLAVHAVVAVCDRNLQRLARGEPCQVELPEHGLSMGAAP